MNLEQIKIDNFRSVEVETIDFKPINKSNTYCLLGINESGKSSILKGISLFDGLTPSYPEDFFDDLEPVKVSLLYSVGKIHNSILRSKLTKDFDFPKEIAAKVEVKSVELSVEYEPEDSTSKEYIEKLTFKVSNLKGYQINGGKLEKISKTEEESEPIDFQEFFEEHLPKFFWTYSHDINFWESSDQYLILDEIDLSEFAKEPTKTSIPLRNCFILSGIPKDKIEAKIEKLSSPARIRNLESLLSEKVTEHINEVWPEHPIEIKFEINNNKVSLLIEDVGVKHKAKTTSQRSDGFKQFISFLLTLSTERVNQNLRKSIMLLDEPETHLHPQAQINLMKELIKLTTDLKHIVIYATHSNYMIDKVNLDRNIKVFKRKNETTKLEKISKSKSSYSEVNYTVFEIATTDYHNELYGYLEDVHPSKLNGVEKDRNWINEKSGKTESVSLPKYIRNAIHHPENNSNRAFTAAQLKKSIEMLRKLKYK
ncbi:AAA family ATPase [Kriegella sp. EG-1]|nr:AAA family ATPase [Flavobacteriaceae bacterium EG-1]